MWEGVCHNVIESRITDRARCRHREKWHRTLRCSLRNQENCIICFAWICNVIPWKGTSCFSNRALVKTICEARRAFEYCVFEASKVVSTKTLVLKHYYHCQGNRNTHISYIKYLGEDWMYNLGGVKNPWLQNPRWMIRGQTFSEMILVKTESQRYRPKVGVRYQKSERQPGRPPEFKLNCPEKVPEWGLGASAEHHA